jgi:hypothetical protein
MISHTEWKWFWIGAGLWAAAVTVKLVIGLLMNAAVLGWLKEHLPYAGFIAGSGLFIGIESSACEIGLTIVAVAVWRQFSREAGRAIAIGVGAGAIEAFLLGAVAIVSVAVAASGLAVGEEIWKALAENQQKMQLAWLIGPLERALALLVHASSRALVLLGFGHSRPGMVFGGLAIFTVVDGIAGAAIVVSKTHRDLSPW